VPNTELAKRSLPKKLEQRLKIVTVALSLLFGLALTEIVLRIVHYVPGFVSREMFVSRIGLPDAKLRPYALRPGFAGSYAGGVVSIDLEGNRLVVANPKNTNHSLQTSLSVLLLGDSVVFGQGLSDDQTIASRLQAALLNEHRFLQVQNIGVPGYSTWNEYIALKEFLKTHHPRRVILVYVGNDATLENDAIRLDSAFTLVENSPIHRLLAFLYRNVYATSLIADGAKHLKAGIVRQEMHGFSMDLEGLEYSMQAVAQIRNSCSESGAQFEVAIYRDVVAYVDPIGTARYEAELSRRLSALGIRWFLLKSHIENLDPLRAQVRWNDPHPSAEATNWVARDLLVELAKANTHESIEHQRSR
jgi:lysophospholipase L1-like esterase